MSKITWIGIIFLLAGCGTATHQTQIRTDNPAVEGWYNPNKTAVLLSQDMDYCNALCASS